MNGQEQHLHCHNFEDVRSFCAFADMGAARYFVRISLLRLLLDRGMPALSLDSLTEKESALNLPPPQPFLVRAACSHGMIEFDHEILNRTCTFGFKKCLRVSVVNTRVFQ